MGDVLSWPCELVDRECLVDQRQVAAEEAVVDDVPLHQAGPTLLVPCGTLLEM